MRITFILPTVNMSGGIKVAAIHAKAMIDKGHQVTLVSPPPKNLTLKRKVKSFLQGAGWSQRIQSYPSHLDGYNFDHRILNIWRPVIDDDVPDADVVIATWWETAEWVAKLHHTKGAKVYFIQGYEIFEHLPIERCHATYRLPFHKIVIAAWLRDVMQNQYGDPVVDLVPNSVNHMQFFSAKRHKQSVPTIGFVYSAAPFKDIRTAYAAIALVRTELPELRVISFGANPPQPHVPLPPGTEFTLSPPQEKIRDFYSQCDVWLASSKQEGFFLPAMEAMACRTPVVSTKTGWPAEAIQDGENGFLVDAGDAAAMAFAAKKILSLSDEKWQTMSRCAYATASKGSWEESSQMFELALHHAIERASRGEIAGSSLNNL